MRPTVLMSREQWASLPRVFNEPPPIYFGCRWCREPLVYRGLLTADGYAVEPVTCGKCGQEFGFLLHGYSEHRPTQAENALAAAMCQAGGDAV